MLDALRPEIHGMVHCSGGAQTKVMHFVENKRVIKDNLFPIPPLFKTIKEQSGTDVKPEHAEEIIAISKSFGVDAQIIGRVEAAEKNELIIESPYGTFKY